MSPTTDQPETSPSTNVSSPCVDSRRRCSAPAIFPSVPPTPVHGSPRPSRETHLNRRWPSLSIIPYQRYTETRAAVRVRAMRGGGSTVEVSIGAHFLLQTRALERREPPHDLCVHFTYAKVCLLGSRCKFIHAVRLVDPYPEQFAVEPDRQGNVVRSHGRGWFRNPYSIDSSASRVIFVEMGRQSFTLDSTLPLQQSLPSTVPAPQPSPSRQQQDPQTGPTLSK